METNVRDSPTTAKTWPSIAIGLFVAFGGIMYGYDTGLINGIEAMPYWQSLFSTGYRDSSGQLNVTSSQQSLIVSILSIGTLCGALTAAPFADRIGRRWSLIACAVVFCLGVALQTAAIAIKLFVIGRLFAGMGVGGVSTLVPLYQSETAPKSIRGLLVGAYQLSITVGLLLAGIVNNATKDRNDTSCYRIPVAIQFAWGILLICGMTFLPDTPRYWIKRDNLHSAVTSLSKLRRLSPDSREIQDEIGDIQAGQQRELCLGKGSYADCFKGKALKCLITGCGLQALQQLSGVNFIFYYGTQYFRNSGLTNSFIVTLITNLVNVAGTLPGLWAIEKWGRRPMLIWGAVSMCVSQYMVAIVGTTTSGQDSSGAILVKNADAQKAAIAFICLHIFFFASTWGPLAWAVSSEIFPLRVRAKSLSIAAATNWLFNWALAYATPYLVNYGKGNGNLQSKVFFIWGSACLVAVVFSYFMVYETKGLSLEEVHEMYQQVSSARLSVGWVPPSANQTEEKAPAVHDENV